MALQALFPAGAVAHTGKAVASLNARMATQRAKAELSYTLYRGWNVVVRIHAVACTITVATLAPHHDVLSGLSACASQLTQLGHPAAELDLPDQLDLTRPWAENRLDSPQRMSAFILCAPVTGIQVPGP